MVIKNLSKSFSGKTLFSSLSYEMENGVYCLMAPSGAGKTTFLRIIMGLEVPDGGMVHGAGRISAVFQSDTLCPGMDAVSNICLACGGSKYERAVSDLELLGVSGSDLNKPVSEFSGGMRRRCEIVRAMLSESDTVLMDEPFNGLDSARRETAAGYILSRLDGRLLIAVTHIESDAKLLNAVMISF